MKLKVSLQQIIFFVFLSFLFNQKTFSQCFQIESILVDACDTGSDEGLNEMVRFKVGPTAINTSSLSVSWPNNSWELLAPNATTKSKVDDLNLQITAAGGCGQLIQPTSGVLPANAKVILVTSFNFDIALNYFGAITEDIYIIFQHNASTTTGHFANYNSTSGLRTLSMSFGGGCSDSVTYQRSSLIDTSGNSYAENGATVNFTPSGTATYVNNGCVAPVDVFSVDAGNSPISACAGATISLLGIAQGQQTVGWTAPSGSFSSPTTLATNYTIDPTATGAITLTLKATNSCSVDKTDIVIVNVTSVTTPIINCGTTTSSSVQFIWAAVAVATGYSVSYQIGIGIPTSFVAIGNVNNYTVNGLAAGVNVTITVLPTGGTGTCFVSSTKMCTSNGCVPPVLTITNPASTCSPFTIDLTFPYVTSGSTGGGALSYWTDSAATIALVNPTTINASGTYYIKSTSGTCLDIKPVVVIVNALPYLYITNPAAVCSPATVDITSPAVTAGSVSGTFLTYWKDNLATVPLINPNAISVSGVYYIKSSFPACTIATSVLATINSSPVLVITNPLAVCSLATVDITLPAVTAGSTGSGTLTYWTDAAATITLASPTSVSVGGTYYIKMGSGTCADIKPVTVTITTSPVLTITNPVAVCSPAMVDITLPAVTAGSIGLGALSYWTNAAGTIALSNPSAIAASGTYYIKSISGTCTDIKPVTVIINPAPVLTITNPPAVCSPATVDITLTSVTVGSTGSGTLTYWTNLAATSSLASPTAIATGGTYYIKSTLGTCTDIKPVLVSVNPTPVLTITNPSAVCSPATVDITLASVTVGSTGSGTLTYWTNLAATSGLASPTSVNVGGTYYIKMGSGTCTDIKPVTVTINPTPVLTITNPSAVCSPATVDITLASVTVGSTGSGTLTYWTNLAATSGLASPTAIATGGTYYIKSTLGTCTDIKPVLVSINPTPVLTITNPSAVCSPATVDITLASVTAGSTGSGTSYWTDAAATITLASPTSVNVGGTYYIKMGSGTCTDIKPVTVTINPTPVLTITNPSAVCSPATVDITLASVTVGSTVSGTLTYWTNLAATIGLASPTAIATGGTYYIKSTLGTCTDIKPVLVSINPTPVLTITNPSAVCSPATVDITLASVTVGSTGSGTLTYWINAAATTALASPMVIAVSGTYYIKSTLGTCTDIKPVLVSINPTPVLTITNPPAVCSPATVDITLASVTVGSTGSGTLTYWTNLAATSGLASPTAIAVSGTYYIKSTSGTCSDIKPVTVTVSDNQPINSVYYLCIDKAGLLIAPVTIDSNLSPSQYSFAWTFNGNTISNTTSSYPASILGIYKVIATDLSGGCVKILIADVKESNEATATATVGTDFDNQQEIIVTVTGGLGNYSYQLNDGLLQNSNIFSVSQGGEYVVNVIDNLGCNNFILDVTVLNYPRFFTPNGDGFHDTWNVSGLPKPDKSVIFIYDRYGKLLKEIAPLGEGWDGIYNSHVLPSTDYWFKILYQDAIGVNKEFKAHFSLKR